MREEPESCSLVGDNRQVEEVAQQRTRAAIGEERENQRLAGLIEENHQGERKEKDQDGNRAWASSLRRGSNRASMG